MDYRDERTALRARVDSLETELASARAELAGKRATEEALRAAERENEKLRAEVKRLTPKPRQKQQGQKALVAVMATLAVTAAAGMWLVVARKGPEPDAPAVAASATADPVRRLAEGPAGTATPEVSQRVTAVEWEARVTSADGLPYAPGAPCKLRATVRSDGARTLPPEVEIACEGKWLYRSTDPNAGVSMTSYDVEEAPGPDEGSYRVALTYQDTGQRTGERAQASVSTWDRVATAWRDTAPAYRVVLAVDELSSAWKGPALFTAHEGSKPKLRASLSRTGRATEAQGTGLVKAGDACRVDVRPAWNPLHNCRIRVSCGLTTLYGASNSGFNACRLEGSTVLGVTDPAPSNDDHDPALALDLPRGTVEVTDTTPNAWSVKVRLDPPKL